MRNNIFYSALIPLFLTGIVLAQVPAIPDSKPASRSKERTSEKPSAQDSQPLGKQADGTLKLGAATESEKLLDEAIAKVGELKSVHADLRQKVEMLGYEFTAEGQYAISPNLKLLYELKVQLTADTTGTIKEVSDGRMHWRNQKILDTQELVKLDIKKLSDVFDKPQFDKELRGRLLQELGFSGMVPLMKGLRESQKFESHTEETLDGKPVYVLSGQWREEAISQSSFRGQQLSLSKLPPYMPSKCTVWIGKEDGWLYKLELESVKKVQGSLTKMTLEFLNPRLGGDLPDTLFAFEPPEGVRAEDQTEVIYQRLSAVLQQATTRSSTSQTSAPESGTDVLRSRPAAGAGDTTPKKDPSSKP